jgi:prepilin-type N-terminal cleavage/methylation domain-containing protein
MGGHDTTRGGSGGFSLVEVLVALLILSFVALGIAGLFSHAMVSNASGHDYALLASEARFALEGLQALAFNDPALNDTEGTPATLAPQSPNFTISYTVEDFRILNWTEASSTWTTSSDPNQTNLKRISMTVASTNQILEGRRVLTVTSLKVPG